MRLVRSDSRVVHAAHRRALPLLALALAAALIVPGAASAQTGGSTPGGTEPPPPTSPTPSSYSEVFPLPGAHTWGDGFGTARAGRSHQGQDIFAPCGSPLVSVSNARVIKIATHGAAGNYLVIRNNALKHDYVYAHLAAPAPLVKGQILTPGYPVGNVGQTGNASGCHLHFELWSGKYYRGGRAVNPRAALTLWDSYS